MQINYDEYKNVKVVSSEYRDNNNIAILLYTESDALLTIASLNTDMKLPDNQFVLKNYGENAGIEDVLIEQGVIKPTPVKYVLLSEWVPKVPIYELTDKAINEIKPLTEETLTH